MQIVESNFAIKRNRVTVATDIQTHKKLIRMVILYGKYNIFLLR
jgi:hypothetical protein